MSGPNGIRWTFGVRPNIIAPICLINALDLSRLNRLNLTALSRFLPDDRNFCSKPVARVVKSGNLEAYVRDSFIHAGALANQITIPAVIKSAWVCHDMTFRKTSSEGTMVSPRPMAETIFMASLISLLLRPGHVVPFAGNS